MKRSICGTRASFRMVVLAALTAAPTAALAETSDDAIVERGAYLARAGNCVSCHSRPDGAKFAGGVAIKSPFGTMYSTNITPDPDTGIGNWTEEDFAKALRQGIRKDGAHLYPSMPYTEFTKLTDDDVSAIWAYLQTVEPVHEEDEENVMRFPFNVRLGLSAWNAMYFNEGRFVPDSSHSAEWNRGAYLVQGLTHCGSCHTPRNMAFAENEEEALGGAVIGGWYAPDISGDDYSIIKDWTEEELANFLKVGHTKTRTPAIGPMHEAIEGGLSHLSDEDLMAIAVYLKNQTAGTTTAEPPPKLTLSATRKAEGRVAYESNCAGCHGDNGAGRHGVAPTLIDNATMTGREPHSAIRAVLEGFDPRDKWGAMPSFAYAMTNQEVADAINYARTSWGNEAQPNARASLVAYLRGQADLPNGGQRTASRCLAPPTEWLDDDTMADIRKAIGEPESMTTETLVSNFRERHPEVKPPQVVVTLSGAYCQHVTTVSDRPLGERLREAYKFMGEVTAAVRSEGKI